MPENVLPVNPPSSQSKPTNVIAKPKSITNSTPNILKSKPMTTPKCMANSQSVPATKPNCKPKPSIDSHVQPLPPIKKLPIFVETSNIQRKHQVSSIEPSSNTSHEKPSPQSNETIVVSFCFKRIDLNFCIYFFIYNKCYFYSMQQNVPKGKIFIWSFADFLKERNALIDRQFCSRKRKRNVHLWKRNKNKNARNAGLAYFTYKKVSMPAKKPNLMHILCKDKCRRNCSHKISIKESQTLFTAFYSLDLKGKNVMLFNCIQRKDVKHHRMNTIKQKKNTFTYNIKLPNYNEPITICKSAFCSIFQISTKKVEIIQKNILWGK